MIAIVLLAYQAICAVRNNSSTFQSGMSFVEVNGVKFDSAGADLSLAQYAKQTSSRWVAIVTDWFQNDINSTLIIPNRQVTEPMLAHAIRQAKKLGLKVMLKPHVDLLRDPTHWRAEIGKYFTVKQWDQWFLSYSIFIVRFVKLALANDVDQFCVGTELTATEGQALRWSALIQGIRLAITGSSMTLVYAANWGPTTQFVPVWSGTLLDAVGVDAYFPITKASGGWSHWSTLLSSIAATYSKRIVFTEFGYCSMANAGVAPWNCTQDALDLAEQANLYNYLYGNLSSQTWFAGSFGWTWTTDPRAGGDKDPGYTPQGKPLTLKVLSDWYQRL